MVMISTGFISNSNGISPLKRGSTAGTRLLPVNKDGTTEEALALFVVLKDTPEEEYTMRSKTQKVLLCADGLDFKSASPMPATPSQEWTEQMVVWLKELISSGLLTIVAAEIPAGVKEVTLEVLEGIVPASATPTKKVSTGNIPAGTFSDEPESKGTSEAAINPKVSVAPDTTTPGENDEKPVNVVADVESVSTPTKTETERKAELSIFEI